MHIRLGDDIGGVLLDLDRVVQGRTGSSGGGASEGRVAEVGSCEDGSLGGEAVQLGEVEAVIRERVGPFQARHRQVRTQQGRVVRV